MRWVARPERMPYRCFVSGQDDEAHGPYLDTGKFYSEPGYGDDRELSLYLAAHVVQGFADAPGSPFEDSRAAAAAAQAQRDEHIADLETQLAEARSEIEAFRAHQLAPIDEEALARNLKALMDKPAARQKARA